MHPQPNEQHLYHHTVPVGPKLNLKIIQNTKGYNFEITVTGAASVSEAMALIGEAHRALDTHYPGTQPAAGA